jgi:uncharacterized membrane protein YdbT with pleckstrin-like domain
MSNEYKFPGSESNEIKQSSWAWIWGGAPWIVLAIWFWFGSGSTGMTIFAVVLGVAVTAPRYISWRKTLYVINESSITYQKGSIGPTQTVELPAEQFQRITDNPGMFGKFLGYTTVSIRLKGESNYMRFSHIPTAANMTQKLIKMRDRYSDYDEAKELEELAIIAAGQRGEHKAETPSNPVTGTYDNPDTIEPVYTDISDTISCANCDSEIQSDARFCAYCGSPITTEESS